jgi:hypothetical protein
MIKGMEKVLLAGKMETNMLETSKMTRETVMESTHGVKIIQEHKIVRTTLEIGEIITTTAMGLFNSRMETNIKANSLMVSSMDSGYTIMHTVIDMKESGIKVINKVMGHTSLKMEINKKENT